VDVRFCRHVPISLQNKNMEKQIPRLLSENGFFGLQNSVVPFRHMGKKNSSTLNIMILQTVRNKCVRFGGHIDIEASYKIS
jgi:hypothetical protein